MNTLHLERLKPRPSLAAGGRPLWVLCGRLAGPLWLVGTLLTAALQPEGEMLRYPLSYLGARGLPYAALFNAGMALSGLLVLGFAWGLHRALGPEAYGFWGPLLIGAFGLFALLGTALLPCAANCAESGLVGQLHYVAAVLGAAGLFWGLACLAPRFERLPAWRGRAALTHWAAHLCLVGFVLFDVTSAWPWTWLAGYRGAIQLGLFAVAFGWMSLASGEPFGSSFDYAQDMAQEGLREIATRVFDKLRQSPR